MPVVRRRRRARGSVRLILAMSLAIAFGGVLAQSALAAGPAFVPGDVLLTGSGSVQEYSPSGALVETVPGTTGASGLCFDPSGQHLILPGVGLLDSSGQMLSSSWASVSGNLARCVADASGHVFVTSYADGDSIREYGLRGTLLRTFVPTGANALSGSAPFALTLAPDGCTLYYGGWQDVDGVDRLNVCTGIAEAPFAPASVGVTSLVDDLQALPTGGLVLLSDTGASLFTASGALTDIGYSSPFGGVTQLRTAGVDPDGTSVWLSTLGTGGVARFSLASGQLLSEWGEYVMPSPTQPTSPPVAGGSIAVYGPPLLGDADLSPHTTGGAPGTATAFADDVSYTGTLNSLHLYVDGSSTATQAAVGIYANQHGRPGALLEQATLAGIVPGSWNDVPVPALSVTVGQSLWIAVLAPEGGGQLTLRATLGAGSSQSSAQRTLTALPAEWSAGPAQEASGLSAYGQG